jgi:mono/diheme cytochrome c family protein
MLPILIRLGMPPARCAAAVLAASLCTPLATYAQTQSRGELLYRTHCAECHSSQMHWREKKTVRDWTSLRAQVTFWQLESRLGWGDDDITSVARYLNDAFYRLPPPPDAKAAGALPGAPAGPALLSNAGVPPRR